MQCLPFGYQISKRSARQIRTRCILLSMLFVPLIAWRWFCSDLGLQDATDTDAAEPRLLGSMPDVMHGYDCLSEDEYWDRKNISLLLVRKSHVTMGGKDGNGCLSGEGPCLKKGKEAYLALYIPGMLYMFIALAIICDEFFVPSLENFVAHYGISMDVAGATFMAAGGSMPELFCSFISVFQETDIGFAAIVGSAVFNVLFVIAVCALASEKPLELTPWPLARDCTFYILGLMLVVIFFRGNSKNEIEWWEALLLFAWYLLYCGFMVFNESVKNLVDSIWKSRAIAPEAEVSQKDETRKKGIVMAMPSSFRSGIINLLTQHASITETAGIAVVTEIKGSLQEIFSEMDDDGDGCIDEREFGVFMEKLGWKGHPGADKDKAASELWKRMPLTEDDKLSFEAFKTWYMVSEARVDIEVRRVFEKLDHNGDGTVEGDEIRRLLASLGHHPSTTDLEEILADIRSFIPEGRVEKEDENEASISSTGTPPRVKVHFQDFERWYRQSVFCRAHQKSHQIEVLEEQGFTINWPRGCNGKDPTYLQLFWYIFTYPLCAAMFCSLPDVRRPGMEGKVHWAVIEFLLSLVWIAIFSLALYESMVVSSNTIGIPPPVAAVTILAAGTSVPDLLSSYVVARQGEGDMAVSSSIGSNIFDITVGLPIPWLAFSAYRSRPVRVKSQTLGFSVIVLIAMLASVIFTVMCMRWKMTKGMGAVMFALYLVFILQDICQQLPSAENPLFKISDF